MPIRIYSKDPNDLNSYEDKSCKKMISGGAIYNLYVDSCETKIKNKSKVFIAKDGKIPIGWALIKHAYKKQWQFMVYVKLKYRRQKIGTRLYNRAKKYFNLSDDNIDVYRTSSSNTKFFDSITHHT